MDGRVIPRGGTRRAAARDEAGGSVQRRSKRVSRGAFWCEDLGTYALALDGDKHPCRVPTSNPGHCLFTGIVAPEHAARLANTLMSPARSAAGVCGRSPRARFATIRCRITTAPCGRTIPPSAAAGLARYGFTWEATRILEAMFDLSRAAEFHRLPELICGFERGRGEAPTLYPVACAPQAWAAGAVYLLLEACLGLRIDALAGASRSTRPCCPAASTGFASRTCGWATRASICW
jgi:glycogen debranching enzyme